MKCQRSVSRQEGVDLLRANSIHDRPDRGPVIGVRVVDQASHHPSDHMIFTVMLIESEVDLMVDRHLTPFLALDLLRDEIRVPINLSQLSLKPWFKLPPC